MWMNLLLKPSTSDLCTSSLSGASQFKADRAFTAQPACPGNPCSFLSRPRKRKQRERDALARASHSACSEFPGIPQTCCCRRVGSKLVFPFWQDVHNQQIICRVHLHCQRYGTQLKALLVFRELVGIPVTAVGWVFVKFFGYLKEKNKLKD